MSQQLKESLSAVMDGEADEFEIRRVLNEAAQDDALRGVWTRYHLVRSVLRGEARIARRSELGGAFWARVDAADASVADEADAVAVATTRQKRSSPTVWQQRILGAAVAASVAAAVIIGLGSDETAPRIDGTAPEVVQLESADAADVRIASIETTAAPPVMYPSAVDLQRMQAYMLHHEQQVALSNQARAVPFVKVAAFESR